jgi:DNA invertase Pin-like site-specific DNA recombinase
LSGRCFGQSDFVKLIGSLLCDDRGHPRYWATVWQTLFASGVAAGPLEVRLSAVERLYRTTEELCSADRLDELLAERLKARNVDLIVADMGSEPVIQNGVSRMFFGMLALVAEFERERIRERSADGRAAKRAAGGHIGGSVPFGYRKVGAGRAARLEPDPVQQAALANMRALAAQGLPFRAIAAAV